MSNNTIKTLDGSTFLVSTPNGDIDARPDQPEGLFFKDTRHLSKWTLSINGLTLDVLSTDSIEYYYAQHFCVPPTGTIYKNPTLSVVRRRFVGNGFVEDLTVLNHSSEVQDVELRLDFGSDFCDLFEVKDALKKKGSYYQATRSGRQVLGYKREDWVRETLINSTVTPTEQTTDHLTFRFALMPKSLWTTNFHVTPVTGKTVHNPKFATEEGDAMRRNLKDWIDAAPAITCHPDANRLYMRSLMDIAALRFKPDTLAKHSLPAAGLPWFMALFGRDSLITSYQMLPFNSELACTTLQALAEAQGKKEVELT